MANRARKYIQSAQEMDESNLEVLNHSRLYSRETDGSEKVAVVVNEIAGQVLDAPQRILLTDTETVKRVTSEYLRSCARTGILPSKVGLARGLGCSRQALDSFVQHNPDHNTTVFLQIAFDAFSEILTMGSLVGANHPIVGIFVLKSLYGWRDNADIPEAISGGPLGNELSTEEILRKYSDLPDE